MGDWVIMGLWVMWANEYAVHGGMFGKTDGQKDRGLAGWVLSWWVEGQRDG